MTRAVEKGVVDFVVIWSVWRKFFFMDGDVNDERSPGSD